MRHYPCERQDGKKDCGVCCLLTIIKTYKGEVSKEYLRTLTKTDKNGVNAYYIMQAAKQIGFIVEGVEGDLENLETAQLPCIAHIIVNKSYRHFVVIHEIKKERKEIIIADPALGIRTLSFKEFNDISTSRYLLFELDKPLLSYKHKSILKEIIVTLIKEEKKKLFLIFVFSCFVIFLNIIFSFSFQLTMNDGIELNAKQNILFLFLLFLFLLCISTGMNYIRLKVTIWIQRKLDKSIFQIIIKHLFHLPYLYFKTRTTGEVMSRLSEVQQLQEGIGQLLLSFFLDILTIILISIVIYILSPLLCFILFISFVILMLITSIQILIFKRSVNKFHESYDVHNSHLTEMIQGITSVKNMQAEDFVSMKTINLYKIFLNEKTNIQENFLILSQAENVMNKLPQLFLLVVGGYSILEGNMVLGQLLTSYHLSSYYLQSVTSFLHFFMESQMLISIFKRLEDLLMIPKEEMEIDKKYMGSTIEGSVDIKNLTYSYNLKKIVFKNFSILISPREKIMIHGDSGCGKSTLAKLILRYIPIENKMIFINSKDVNDYSLMELRNTISYLSQDELLFTGSIYQNIVWFRDIIYDDFLEVAKTTMVDDIIKKSSLGYEYLVEENGFNLSGGEKQKILLARALLKKANIYILDESFSEIDVAHERQILKSMFETYSKSTFLVISHRLSNKDLYDRKIKIESRTSI